MVSSRYFFSVFNILFNTNFMYTRIATRTELTLRRAQMNTSKSYRSYKLYTYIYYVG
jgi:hypothetical protein